MIETSGMTMSWDPTKRGMTIRPEFESRYEER
jgi:hypothetical protein